MKKISVLFVFTLLFISSVSCFDWPQDNTTKDSFISYFGQNRGTVLSTSVLFNNEEQIKASENGRVLVILTDTEDESDFFPSTLGTAVIVSHNDNLLSVYANMDTQSLTINDKTDVRIDTGTILGVPGNTGWHENDSNFEFQIIDTKNSSAINPKVLMTRSETELPLLLTGICLANKNGDFFEAASHKTYQTGLYRIYQKRNSRVTPYKTTIMINGAEVDQINYDLIVQENGKTCLNGKKKYTNSDIYPDEKLQLLGEAMLTPGKTTLGLVVTDILGNNKQLNYNINIF